MFGLIDCNNFFVSCERVFRPDLNARAVVVLSSNDGVIIARSNEAKALGIGMAAPVFQVRDILERNKVVCFSSNFALYADLSNRVMSLLADLTPEIEVYSIDEAFINFSGLKNIDLHAYGKEIVNKISKGTGIPVSLGVAPTKTLCKIANHYAKKHREETQGVCFLTDEEQRLKLFKELPIEEVWGIGRRYAKFLHSRAIHTISDFINMDEAWVREQMTIVGVDTWHELQGRPRLAMSHDNETNKSICTSRTFSKKITELSDLEEAVAEFAASCGRKLRQQKTVANMMTVFIHTSYFQENQPQHNPSFSFKLPIPTNQANELIKQAIQGLRQIYKSGFSYKKTGVILSEIVPDTAIQTNLFHSVDIEKQDRLMEAMDKLNQTYGREKVRIAKQAPQASWRAKKDHVSPCYSTNLADIIKIQTG